MIKNIIDELKSRDMLKDISNKEKILKGQKSKTGAYCGFDPTSDSLHIGNLIQLLVLKRFAHYGFKTFGIVGEATALIGDPSGKKEERTLKSEDEIKKNIKNISEQIKKICPNLKLLNNNDWLKNMTIKDFLYNVGKNFNVSYLISKDHIKSRLNSGISYTEFTYSLLQSYDFYHLYNKYGITIQIGGSDQWGNITSGIEFIKDKTKNNDSEVAGLTINLLLKPDGNKFGKTETGTIWLDRDKTTPYDFYQFFFNQTDNFSILLLKYFSSYTIDEIIKLKQDHLLNPKDRLLQKTLASHLVKLVHSQKDLNNIEVVNNILFKNNTSEINKEIIEELLVKIIPFFTLDKSNSKLIDALIRTKICCSKREAKEFITQKAIMINGEPITDLNYNLKTINALYNKYFLLKKGKKKYYLLSI